VVAVIIFFSCVFSIHVAARWSKTVKLNQPHSDFKMVNNQISLSHPGTRTFQIE